MLQVNSVCFFEHHTIDGDHQALGASVLPQNIRRLCVMEIEVTNRTEGPLQVQAVVVFTFAFLFAQELTV